MNWADNLSLANYNEKRDFTKTLEPKGKVKRSSQNKELRSFVFFDYNQNSRGKTIASVYSLRPNAAATVSMPVEWNNLGSVLPTDFTITSVPQLITKKNHIWAGVLGEKQNISKIISKVQ